MTVEEELLKKIRSLNRLLQRAGANPLVFSDISMLCGDLLESNILIVTKKGKLLDVYNHETQKSYPFWPFRTGETLPSNQSIALNRILETVEDSSLARYGIEEKYDNMRTVIIPLESTGDRIGTLIICREDQSYSVSDIILMEYAATIVGIELTRSIHQETEKEEQQSSVCRAAISTLSYSELEAVVHIFQELGGMEGMLVASKIADKVGITRSVIVNALRKFESAGIIESRSLGMKGTFIRILNPALPDELKKYNN